jgi:hypothetical protein
MQFGELGLANNTDPPLRLGRFWTNRLREFFVTPLPDVIGSSGIHLSRHLDDHLHIKSDKLNIHEDIDFKLLAKKARTLDQLMIRPTTEGQPARIYLINTDYLLNRMRSSISPNKIFLDTNLLSQSTVEIELLDTSHLLDRMCALRDNRYAKAGDIAFIHGLNSNELSFYVYPRMPCGGLLNSPFITFRSDLLESDLSNLDMEMIRRLMPFIDPLIDPMMKAMRKASGYLSTTSPRLNMLKNAFD